MRGKMGAMFDAAMKYLTRKVTAVSFEDRERTRPVSPVFGIDRGTPIDRYYIETFLDMNGGMIRGRVLEVGDDYYGRRYARGKVEAFEVLHATRDNKAATLVADLTDVATLPVDSFDCFICTQTFNFIFEVGKAVEGAHYLLKPGGTLLATVSGISQISRYDMERWGDYWRFTTASVQKLFGPVFKGGVEIKSYGNVLAATAFLQGVSVEDLPDRALLDERDQDYQMVIAVVARKGP